MKLSKKRIEAVAKNLFLAWLPDGETSAWRHIGERDKDSWRQLAVYVLTELKAGERAELPAKCSIVNGNPICED